MSAERLVWLLKRHTQKPVEHRRVARTAQECQQAYRASVFYRNKESE